jgi:AraC-like DNA-binding protein
MNWKFRLDAALFDLLEKRQITAQHVVVLLCLAKHADWTTGRNARPGVETLARKCGVSEKTVRRCLADGEQLGLITMVRRGGGTGMSARGNTYEFCFDATGQLAPQSSTASTTPGRTSVRTAGETPDISDTRRRKPHDPSDLFTSNQRKVKRPVPKENLRSGKPAVQDVVSRAVPSRLCERIDHLRQESGIDEIFEEDFPIPLHRSGDCRSPTGEHVAQSLNQRIATRTRQAQAVELRREGSTYADIAAHLGYSDASAARKAVRRAIKEIGQDEARTHLALQYDRLNEMLAQTWPAATDASHPKCLQAINLTLKIMERMDDLLLPDVSGPRQHRDSHGRGHIGAPTSTVIAIPAHAELKATGVMASEGSDTGLGCVQPPSQKRS